VDAPELVCVITETWSCLLYLFQYLVIKHYSLHGAVDEAITKHWIKVTWCRTATI